MFFAILVIKSAVAKDNSIIYVGFFKNFV
jgi:hypothetical protein